MAALSIEQGAAMALAPIGPIAALPIYGFVPKDSPHPNAAKLFIAWLGTGEAKKALAETEYGALTPCGPFKADKMMCGKDLQIYRLDTIEKAKKAEEIRQVAVKALRLDQR